MIRSGRKCAKVGAVETALTCTADNDCKSTSDSCCNVDEWTGTALNMNKGTGGKKCLPSLPKNILSSEYSGKYYSSSSGCKGR